MHPVHISSLNIEYNDSRKAFIVSFKMNKEDLESAVQFKYNKIVKILENEDNNEADKWVNSYILDNFALIINDKDKTRNKLKFVSKSTDNESLWFIYEYKFNGKLKSVVVKNRILQDLYMDQVNLLIFTYREIQNAFKLRYNENVAEIDLKKVS